MHDSWPVLNTVLVDGPGSTNAEHDVSDSTDVLWWIQGRGKDFRLFAVNRIDEIQMFTKPSQWQHVSTEENPR